MVHLRRYNGTPLLYEVSLMATVKMGDNVVVIGGADKRGKPINTVIMYNVKTEQSHMLPPMRCKRWGCTAVVAGNNIVVLGGWGEQANEKSVEVELGKNFQKCLKKDIGTLSLSCEHFQECEMNLVRHDDNH